jgi:hypothetical protein
MRNNWAICDKAVWLTVWLEAKAPVRDQHLSPLFPDPGNNSNHNFPQSRSHGQNRNMLVPRRAWWELHSMADQEAGAVPWGHRSTWHTHPVK